MITREEVLNNRKIWIEFLKDPARKREYGRLESDLDCEHRCCLGHGCAALGIPREVFLGQVLYNGNYGNAPSELIEKVGLFDSIGSCKISDRAYIGSLTSFNDKYEMSPRQIALYLEDHIQGGLGTPFRPLSDYPSCEEQNQ